VELHPRLLEDWPKLIWEASFKPGGHYVNLYHGPLVEITDEWVTEAVWVGGFEGGDFDLTDLVFGSGVRLRDGQVFFVSSGTAMDRLWHCYHEGHWHVSNSLPALLAVTDLSLREDYQGYVDDILTINCGRGSLSNHIRKLGTSEGTALNVLYYNNLVYDGQTLKELPKPDTTPDLKSYKNYRAFLTHTAGELIANAGSEKRSFPVFPVSTISAGYDASAVAAIAGQAGCGHTVTISNSTSFWRGSDSGREIADCLGLSCEEYRHTPRRYRCEETIWAATGQPRGLNYTVLGFPEPLCLLFTGNYGEMAWDLGMQDFLDPASDLSGLCLCEYRLNQGFFHCVPAYWGVRHLAEIREINRSDEMVPWMMRNHYDRPIPRRILEEAGVPRKRFGMRKMNTSSDSVFWWPYSRSHKIKFMEYLKARGMYGPGPILSELIRWAAKTENLVYKNIGKRLGIRQRWRPWTRIHAKDHLFQWANHALKERYKNELNKCKGCA
jgi:hypothetical protein